MSCIAIDSHCHLPLLLEQTGMDINEVMANAEAANVAHMLCVSVDLETLQPILDLAESHANVSASIGVHPNTKTDNEPDVDTLCRIAAHDKVVAIGETGLDYFRSEGDLEWQRERFRVHIRAAIKTGKPLIIHCRDAKQDILTVMREEGADRIGGVMHCFVDDWETAEGAMELGFYISFSGIVTFKNAQELKDVAKRVPMDRMLIETDSPYLAPMPHRGKPNQPAFVRHVGEHIAELRGISVEEVMASTTENFYKLFPLAARAAV